MMRAMAFICACVVGVNLLVWQLHGADGPTSVDPTSTNGAAHVVGARIAFVPTEVDFGERFDDEEVDVSFAIANIGSETLLIDKLDPGCGCAKASETPDRIPPGEQVTVRLRIRLNQIVGPVLKFVSAHSNDPLTPVARMRVHGSVARRLEAELPQLVLRPGSPDDAATTTFTIRSNDGSSVTELQARSLSSTVRVRVLQVSGDRARIEVTTSRFEDDFRSAVQFTRGEAECLVPVTGIAYRDVQGVPARLNLGLARRGEDSTFRLVGRAGVDWSVVRVECEPNGVRARVDGNAVKVSLGPEMPAGACSGSVTVWLRGAQPERVRIPLTAYVED